MREELSQRLGLSEARVQVSDTPHSSVSIAIGRTAQVRTPIGARDISILHNVQTSCGAHPASYPKGTVGSFPVN
jgi:hypothetical protein